jgi:FAD/FMN-containing dehydrogenase/Fe-S oxidoreductase
MDKNFENDLKNAVEGDVYFDEMHRKIYSVDASIYEIEPIGILQPKSKADIIAAVKIAAKHQVPVIARGAATGITGGCLGRALIIDHSRYLNHIESINFHDKFAVCQPGVVQDTLNKILAVRHLRLGPDTSTGDRATLGGMMANNSAGARSLFYGKMVDHVIGLELVLASGETIYFQEVDEQELKHKLALPNSEGHIYREVCRIRDQYRHEIEHHFPPLPRRVSGYNLDELLKPGPLNICKLIVGSEGTLGIATQIKVKITEMPMHEGLCLLFFHSPEESFRTINSIMKHCPLSLELIDNQIIARGRESPSMRDKLEWLQGNPQAMLVAEFQASSNDRLLEKLQHFADQMKAEGIGYIQYCIADKQQMKNVWNLRKSGLGLLLSKRSYSRAVAFIEDLSILPSKLPDFMEKFLTYLKSVGKEAGIYGHVGSGCMHIRPYIDMRDPSELELMKKILEDVSDLVLEYQGALSGEHGDGLVRTWLTQKMFGDKIYQAFKELKAAFDPHHLMNPGKIVEGQPFLENLRLSPSTSISKIDTFLDFSSEGGFELAVDLCNGNGLCRKSEGTMCPSFQATDNEYDSTRARAQALRTMIHSPNPIEKFTDESLYDVLDLCLQCKGCKTECPSQVDMAKMKTEFLYHYQKKHGISLRNRLFGHLSKLLAWGGKFPGTSNFMLSHPIGKALMKKLGVTTHRPFPKLSKKRFSSIVESQKSTQCHGQVVLFNDTYTEFISPEIGVAAVKVLRALGYEVVIPSWKCCGRPLLSKGLLPEARRQAQELVHHLLPYALKDIFIVGLEPSCLLTIIDDYPSLLPQEKLDILLAKTVTFEEFLNRHILNDLLPLKFKSQHSSVKYHMHCYQKSIKGAYAFHKIFNAIPNCESAEIKSGCCGMAGSFGYENEHYEISMKIGNLALFPAIRHSLLSSKIIANGFSCRTQIDQGTDRKTLHLAQFLAELLQQ